MIRWSVLDNALQGAGLQERERAYCSVLPLPDANFTHHILFLLFVCASAFVMMMKDRPVTVFRKALLMLAAIEILLLLFALM